MDLKKILKSNYMKIRPVAAELFYTDGRTDGHDEAHSRFSQFCERASNCLRATLQILPIFSHMYH